MPRINPYEKIPGAQVTSPGGRDRAQVKWGEVVAMGGAAGAVHRGGARKTVSAPLGKLPLYERL